MYNKTSFINETDYAEVSGTRWIMRDLPNYAEGHHAIMRKIMRAHNRIIQRSLPQSYTTLVYRRARQALCTARFCHAGQLATTGTRNVQLVGVTDCLETRLTEESSGCGD